MATHERLTDISVHRVIDAERAKAVAACAAAAELVTLCDAATMQPSPHHPGCFIGSPEVDAARRELAIALNARRPTIRQILEPWGLEKIVIEINRDDLDAPLSSYGFITGTGEREGDHARGEVFVSCGGRAIACFHVGGRSCAIYLVLDTQSRSRWINRADELRLSEPLAIPTERLGRCPGDTLKLVQSA